MERTKPKQNREQLAIVEAAARIVDDQSTALLIGDSDDEGSIISDDGCTVTECLSTELSLSCTIEEDTTVDKSVQPSASALEFVTERNTSKLDPSVAQRGTLLSKNEDNVDELSQSDNNVDAATNLAEQTICTARPGSVSHHETIGDSSAARINLVIAYSALKQGKQSPSTDGQTDHSFSSETKPVEAAVEVIDEPHSVYESTQQNEKELQLPPEVVIPHSLSCLIEESEGRTIESNAAEVEEKPSKTKPENFAISFNHSRIFLPST